MSSTYNRESCCGEEESSPDGRYLRFSQKLGSGAYKSVYLGYDTETGTEIAWNTVEMRRLPVVERRRLKGETDMLKSLQHPHVIKIFNVWDNKEQEQICFATEIVTSGTLKQYIDRVFEKGLKYNRWCRQILEGLKYLHSHRPPIIHRDIKCDNIFINGNSGDIIIGDFGLSSHKTKTHAESVLGTPEFMAPELYDECYTEKVDIWAFGMAVLEMATNQYPYAECGNNAQIFKRVSQHMVPLVLKRIADKQLRSFIELCFLPQEKRLSARDMLEHPFLNPRFFDTKDSFPEVDPDAPVPINLPPCGCENSDSETEEDRSRRGPAKHPFEKNQMPPAKSVVTPDNCVVSILEVLKEDRLKLSLIISINGAKKEIKFDYDFKNETAIEVALDMVVQLKLNQSRAQEIADSIKLTVDSHIAKSLEPTKQVEKKPLSIVVEKKPLSSADEKKPLSSTDEKKPRSIADEKKPLSIVVVSPDNSSKPIVGFPEKNLEQFATVSDAAHSSSVILNQINSFAETMGVPPHSISQSLNSPEPVILAVSSSFAPINPPPLQTGILSPPVGGSLQNFSTVKPVNVMNLPYRGVIRSTSEATLTANQHRHEGHSVYFNSIPKESPGQWHLPKGNMQNKNPSFRPPRSSLGASNPFDELDQVLSSPPEFSSAVQTPSVSLAQTPVASSHAGHVHHVGFAHSQTPIHSGTHTQLAQSGNHSHSLSGSNLAMFSSNLVSLQNYNPLQSQTSTSREGSPRSSARINSYPMHGSIRDMSKDPHLLQHQLLEKYKDCNVEELVKRIVKYQGDVNQSQLPTDRTSLINILFNLICNQNSKSLPPLPFQSSVSHRAPVNNISVAIPHGVSYNDQAPSPATNQLTRGIDPFGYPVNIVVPNVSPSPSISSGTISRNTSGNFAGSLYATAMHATGSTGNSSNNSTLYRKSTGPNQMVTLTEHYTKNPFNEIAPPEDDLETDVDDSTLNDNSKHLEDMVHKIEQLIPADTLTTIEQEELNKCNIMHKKVDHMIALLKNFDIQNQLNVKQKVSHQHGEVFSEPINESIPVPSDILATVMSEIATIALSPNTSVQTSPLMSTTASVIPSKKSNRHSMPHGGSDMLLAARRSTLPFPIPEENSYANQSIYAGGPSSTSVSPNVLLNQVKTPSSGLHRVTSLSAVGLPVQNYPRNRKEDSSYAANNPFSSQ